MLTKSLTDLLGQAPMLECVDAAENADVILWQGNEEATSPQNQLNVNKARLLRFGSDTKADIQTPCRFKQLLLALHKALPRIHQDFTLGTYICSPLDRCLYTLEGEEYARLTEKEASLLEALHDAGESGLSRNALLLKVWGYSETLETHTLETHIYRLRQKIEINPDEPTLLLTLEGGYALCLVPIMM